MFTLKPKKLDLNGVLEELAMIQERLYEKRIAIEEVEENVNATIDRISFDLNFLNKYNIKKDSLINKDLDHWIERLIVFKQQLKKV